MLFLQLQEGEELDEGGPATTGHVRHSVLEALIEATQDVVNQFAILDAMAEITQSASHLFQPRGVVDNGEVALDEAVGLVEEVGDPGVAVAAEERTERAPEGVRRVLTILDDLQGRGGDRGVVARQDDEVVEDPIRGGVSRRAGDMVGEAELGEGGEKLAAPEAIVLLLIVQGEQDVITNPQALNLNGGKGLGGHGEVELLIGGGLAGRGDRGGGGHGGEVGREGSGRVGS